MTYTSISLLSGPLSALVSLGGAELSNSRRYADLEEAQACRQQYAASASINVRIDYSLDDGATWEILADEYDPSGSSVRVGAWQTIPDEAKASDVLVRAFATGSGLLTTVNFVGFEFR